MDLNFYQSKAKSTAIYPMSASVLYPALGLAGETGEVCEKLKKRIRDKVDEDVFLNDIKKELGDVLWYVANLACDLNLTLDEIAILNLRKLEDRQKRGKLKGSGDDR